MAGVRGCVGEPSHVDTTVIDTVVRAGMIPVVAPIGAGVDGHTYNINADTMAGAIAAALGAARLFLLTYVPRVLDKQVKLLTDLSPADIPALQRDRTGGKTSALPSLMRKSYDRILLEKKKNQQL